MIPFRKLGIGGLTGFLCLVAICQWKTTQNSVEIVSIEPAIVETRSPEAEVIRMDKTPVDAIAETKPVQTSGQKPSLFSDQDPLSAEERVKFDREIRQRIRHLLMWRKSLSDSDLTSFRQALSELADRGVADETRKLDSFRVGNLPDDEVIQDAILGVDTLQFLARKGHPLSRDALHKLASRPLIMKESGKFQDKVAAIITIEAFDGLASTQPEQARAIIEKQADERVRPTLVYHYIVGRKIAGLPEEEAIAEGRRVFGQQIVSDAGL